MSKVGDILAGLSDAERWEAFQMLAVRYLGPLTEERVLEGPNGEWIGYFQPPSVRWAWKPGDADPENVNGEIPEHLLSKESVSQLLARLEAEEEARQRAEQPAA